MSFSTQVSLFVERTKEGKKKTRDKVLLKLFGAIIKDTPVDKGRLIGNWNTNVGSPDLSTSEAEGPEISEAKAKVWVNAAKLRDEIYFTNNLPYAEAIENGHGGRSPGVMVQKNVLRFKRLMSKEAAIQRRKKK